MLSRWGRAAPGSPHTSRPAPRCPSRAEPLGACGIIAEPQHGAAAPCGAGCSLLLPMQPTDGWNKPQNSAGLLHQGDGAQRWHHHAPVLGSPPGLGRGMGGLVPALLQAQPRGSPCPAAPVPGLGREQGNFCSTTEVLHKPQEPARPLGGPWAGGQGQGGGEQPSSQRQTGGNTGWGTAPAPTQPHHTHSTRKVRRNHYHNTGNDEP